MQRYKIEKVEYKTKATIEQFTDEFQSSTFEDSDGTPVQFLSNDALSEVKKDFNVHEMVVSGTVNCFILKFIYNDSSSKFLP